MLYHFILQQGCVWGHVNKCKKINIKYLLFALCNNLSIKSQKNVTIIFAMNYHTCFTFDIYLYKRANVKSCCTE